MNWTSGSGKAGNSRELLAVAREAPAWAGQVVVSGVVRAAVGRREEGLAGSEAEEDEAAPWFLAGAAGSTSTGRMVRCTTRSPIPRWIPRLMLSLTVQSKKQRICASASGLRL